MSVVKFSGDLITDWDTFHDVFSKTLGFPDYYGRSMDAWIDCLTYADEPALGMLATHACAEVGDVLTLQLDSIKSFAERCPEQYTSIVECLVFVNWRRIETGDRPILALSFYRKARH